MHTRKTNKSSIYSSVLCGESLMQKRQYTIKPRTLLSDMWQLGWQESGGEWIHVYTWLSPLAVHLKLTQ